MNVFTGSERDPITGGAPTGYGIQGTVPPLKAGALASFLERNASATSNAQGVLGLPGEASALISVAFSPVNGDLVAYGAGVAYVSFLAPPTILEAMIPGSGAAALSITAPASILGASVSSSGLASFSFVTNAPIIFPLSDASPLREGAALFSVTVPSATALPEDDTPPARSASALFSFQGALVPYAIGTMLGSTETGGELTPENIASAVWNALLASHQGGGTAGEALAASGSAGNPWIADLSGYSEGQAGGVLSAALSLIQELLTTGAGIPDSVVQTLDEILAESKFGRQLIGNKAVTEAGAEAATVTVFDDDGTTIVHTLRVANDGSTREPF